MKKNIAINRIAVYIRKHEGITGKIAALPHYIAKSNEFKDIGTIHYNISLAKPAWSLEAHEAALPAGEPGFDHGRSGSGSVFSMPGGLKKNTDPAEKNPALHRWRAGSGINTLIQIV